MADKLDALTRKVDDWAYDESNPTAVEIGKCTFALVDAFIDGKQSISRLKKLVETLLILADFVQNKSWDTVGVLGAVAHKLEACLEIVKEHIPEMAKEVSETISALRQSEMDAVRSLPKNSQAKVLRRVDTGKTWNVEVVTLPVSEINLGGSVPSKVSDKDKKKKEIQQNPPMPKDNEKSGSGEFNSLQDIYDNIQSEQSKMSPVEIGNLTLKIGRLIDKDPSKENIQIGLDILIEMLANASEENKMIIWEALVHKLEYITGKYGKLIPAGQLKELQGVINTANQVFFDWLASLPPQSNVEILRRVNHSTLYYDFDGFLDALGIDEDMDFYEIASIPVEQIIKTQSVPSRNVISEERPQRTPHESTGNNNGGDGPRGPRPGFMTPPPPPPPHQTATAAAPILPPAPPPSGLPPKKPKKKTRSYIDILNLIVVAVLSSSISSVESGSDGCRLTLKPEILNKMFPSYGFIYDFYYSEGSFFPNSGWVDVSKGGGQQSMSAREHVCRFLDMVGLKYQITGKNTIVIKGSTIIKGKYNFFDIKNIKNPVELIMFGYRNKAFTGIINLLLTCVSRDVRYRISPDIAPYTPAAAEEFWNYEARMAELMGHVYNQMLSPEITR
ncbi:MAG: hypothetical protein J6W27_03155 [Alphaproteobacteria bacterium]|nr:hypothetical protein [Alphaproteobacteria bacterium]